MVFLELKIKEIKFASIHLHGDYVFSISKYLLSLQQQQPNLSSKILGSVMLPQKTIHGWSHVFFSAIL